jgi:hypothetical protein
LKPELGALKLYPTSNTNLTSWGNPLTASVAMDPGLSIPELEVLTSRKRLFWGFGEFL